MEKISFGFIGLGLIGGSIAKSIKRVYGKSSYILAYDINQETLSTACQDGIVDEAVSEINSAFSICQFLFLCAPVSFNNENLYNIKTFLSPDCILTDVGSVKTGIHEAISNLNMDSHFIGGHPMAGSEKTGYHNSSDRLVENAFYIITPTRTVSQAMVKTYTEFIKAIGAIPLSLSYEEHDYITAAISHLPHVIAASLVNLVKQSDNDQHIMKMIAAGGFKDITRIASSSTEMWTQIALTNKDNLLQLLHDYIHSLLAIMDTLTASDEKAIEHFFSTAREFRDSLGDSSSGPIKKIPLIYVDIPDKTGIIAAIATILANSQINLKNIGIVHNREFEEGALRIEFYDDLSANQASVLLNNSGYMVFHS